MVCTSRHVPPTQSEYTSTSAFQLTRAAEVGEFETHACTFRLKIRTYMFHPLRADPFHQRSTNAEERDNATSTI